MGDPKFRTARIIEKRRDPPRQNFNDVRLSEVPLHEMRSASGDRILKEVGDQDCEAQGATMHLHVERSRQKSQGQAVEGGDRYTFRLSTAAKKCGVEAMCYFLDSDNGQELAKTEIQRTRGSRLPKGIGRLVYEKILELIQERANIGSKIILHDIERVLTVSQTPLTEDRWNELFVPILLEHGYTRLSDDHWKKLYKPSATQSA